MLPSRCGGRCEEKDLHPISKSTTLFSRNSYRRGVGTYLSFQTGNRRCISPGPVVRSAPRKNRRSLRQILFEQLECRAMLSVESTSPPAGGVFQLSGALTYDVTFGEAINPATVQAADLLLSGVPGASVSSVSVLPGNLTSLFVISGVTQEGTLAASIADGAVSTATNQAEPAFSASYSVDFGTLLIPKPLAPKQPFGSLIYNSTLAGTISPAGDQDRFTVSIDPNETISFIVTPSGTTLKPLVTLFDSANNLVASSTATGAGNTALLQAISTSAVATELYTVQIEDATGSTGGYTLGLTLNAAVEEEGTLPGASNDSILTAQNIDGSAISPTVGLRDWL